MNNNSPRFRIGNGYDIHRLVKDRNLIIGGVELKHPDDLGLDGGSLFQAGEDEVNKTTIESNFKLAKSLGLRGTPASIVNDSIYPGYVKYESLQSLTSQ